MEIKEILTNLRPIDNLGMEFTAC